jgi:hypothetical protein
MKKKQQIIKKKMSSIFIGVPNPSDGNVIFGMALETDKFLHYDIQRNLKSRLLKDGPEHFTWQAEISGPDIILEPVRQFMQKMFNRDDVIQLMRSTFNFKRDMDPFTTVLFFLQLSGFKFRPSFSKANNLAHLFQVKFPPAVNVGMLIYFANALLGSPENILHNGLYDASTVQIFGKDYKFKVRFVESLEDVELTSSGDYAVYVEENPTQPPTLLSKKNVGIGAAALGAAGLAIIYRTELKKFFQLGQQDQKKSENEASVLISKLNLASQLDNVEEVKLQIAECIKHTLHLQQLNQDMQTRLAKYGQPNT